MMKYIEDLLKKVGHRILIVDTSGLSEFELTRRFYLQNNYNQATIIPDFWKERDDKVTFWKNL